MYKAMLTSILWTRYFIHIIVLTWIFITVDAFPGNSPTFKVLNESQTSEIDSATTAYRGVFWQITDIHWDQQYSVDGDETKMCHKEYSSSNVKNGVYGNYLCDSPWPLVKNAIKTMAQLESRPDFVLWTGDSSPHVSDPEPDFAVIFRTLNNVTMEMRMAFQDSVPILPVLGNHDAFPKDYYPVAGEEFYGQYLTKGGWSLVLPKDAQEDFKMGGYYEYALTSGVRVMVLNTNLYYAPNKLRQNVSDPCGQFAWMKKKLLAAREKDYKMIIAAHAPPGYFERFAVIPFFSEDYNDIYVDHLNDFGDVIMGQIYGHEHTDSFKLFSTSNGSAKSVAFLAPSVTPWYPAPVPGGTPINPSLRLFLYNSTTLLDYIQYNLNLTKAGIKSTNTNKEDKVSSDIKKETLIGEPKWEKFYQARNFYGLKSLEVSSMIELYERLHVDDNIFQAYYLLNSAGYNHGKCNSTCRKTQLCAIGNVKIQDLNICMGYLHTKVSTVNHHSMSKYPSHNGNYIIENGFPVSTNSREGYSAPYFVVILLTFGMSLMVVLTVSLAVMLIKTVLARHKRLREEGGINVTDLNIGLRPKGYRPF
ncbi:Acid sphingomyelinase-like phosphodiesterase 3b [Halocaridina rubra]|uniref:Acid sphingomyelinase-like phosphodiesterase 3b n=1 Tax=Halocaridina rubra TaxID=373956 RepID=A0AAN9A8I7_HALRR